MDLNDEVFDVRKAAEFLCKSQRKVYELLNSGRIRAAKSNGKNGSWEILKSSCLEYVHNNHQNCRASDDDADKSKERFNQCQSNYGTACGTVISFPRVANELGEVLKHRTKGKRRSCMTN